MRPLVIRLGGLYLVRIDGEDPFLDARSPTALACRVYWVDGVRSAVPDLRRLRQALKRYADAG